jgi:hypothetical protein
MLRPAMTMQPPAVKTKPSRAAFNRQGFALPVVLAGLLLATALFATAQIRSLAVISQLETERVALLRLAESGDRLTLSISALLAAPDLRRLDLDDASGRFLMFQDVGGLIDLNSAHPELLDRLATHLGLEPAAMVPFRDWRRSGRRLLSVHDFARLTGMPPEAQAELPALATVFSGRFGIDPDSAPLPVLAIAGGRDLPPAFRSGPSSAIFSVWLAGDGLAVPRNLGTVQAATLQDARVLEVN